jgi:hypothetical protein
MRIDMVTIESIAASLRTADEWQKKGQPTWVSHCLSSALMGYLSIAVVEHNEPGIGIAWLKDQKVADLLRRQLATLQTLIVEVESKRLPGSVIAGNYDALVFAHMTWCLEQYALGESFVGFSERQDVGELSTKFWREYAKGMGALIRREQYHPPEMRLRGQERYWIGYLRLIEAACGKQPLDGARAEIDRLFIKRNADKSIRDDSYQIEGSPSQPVRWDFRCHSLLKFIEQKTDG